MILHYNLISIRQATNSTAQVEVSRHQKPAARWRQPSCRPVCHCPYVCVFAPPSNCFLAPT